MSKPSLFYDQYGYVRPVWTGLAYNLLIGAIVAFFPGLALGIALWEKRNCAYTSTQLKVTTHYDWLSGCWVDLPNGRSVPVDSYRATEDTGR